MNYQQGDVVSVSFPFTNLSNSKLRPALVISNNLVTNTGDLIIVMITSKERNDGINLEISAGDIDFASQRKALFDVTVLLPLMRILSIGNLQQ